MNEVLTKEDIKDALNRLGVKKGMLIYVQASLKPFHFVAGGAQSVIDALMECVGYEGTIVMASPTRHLCDPINLKKGVVPRDLMDDVRASIPPFNKKLTAPTQVGEIPIQFMRNEGVLRSNHPMVSFLAWGKYAKLIVDKHPLHFGLNQESPLGKLKEYNGYVVTLGMNYDKCDIFHLAQYVTMKCPIRLYSCPIEKNGTTQWIQLLDLELNNKHYKEIGALMEEKEVVKTTFLGSSYARLFSARVAEENAISYLNR